MIAEWSRSLIQVVEHSGRIAERVDGNKILSIALFPNAVQEDVLLELLKSHYAVDGIICVKTLQRFTVFGWEKEI